jgi:hypothetical protein
MAWVLRQRDREIRRIAACFAQWRMSVKVPFTKGNRLLTKFTLAAMLACAAVAPGVAKNLAVPEKNPVATLMIPDSWKQEEIEFGYSGTSPDGAIFFSVEYARGDRVDKLFAMNDDWMKENKIHPKGEPKKQEVTIGGLAASIFTYQATDENGPTEIDFVLIPAGKRIILMTLWGSEQEQHDNKADLDIIKNSIKAIN